ncbi:MAG: alpha/beta hydrolase domain-containing protein [Reyranellaceae bacterium]
MITAIEITAVEPLADGAPFGDAGAYERVVGIARGALDPAHPGNRGIALIDKAPLNASGLVEYATDFFILRPADAGRGNGRILYEVNNRGRKMLVGNICDGPQGVNDPRTVADLGNGFPLKRGYTLVWSGWDPDAPRANFGLGLTAPVATDDGRPIVRRIRDEFGSGTRPGPASETFRLSYPAATSDPSKVRVTVREREGELRRDVAWALVDNRTVKLLPEGTKPTPGSIYDVFYDATAPKVQGIGFAATRDFISHLRHDAGARAAIGGPIAHTLAIGFSQAGRYLRDHVSQGFNRDEQGRRVFDGIHSHTAGVGRIFFNEPFAQAFRTNTQHEDHGFPESVFPFTTAMLEDPLTGKRGALLQGDDSDPRMIETNTSTEYWQKGASLLHTDPLGARDVALPANSRIYMIAGTQHGGRAGATTDAGPNRNPRNPHSPMPAVRALLVALDEWVSSGKEPPPSRLPTLADGTLVAADATGFPPIPGAAVITRTNSIAPAGDWVDFVEPPRAYRTLVCRVDSDGNEVAGVRLPDIAVPLATYTGWNEYKAPYPTGELADRDGSYFAFAATKTEREANGDPRPSIAERYADRATYVAAVKTAVEALVNDRLLLAEDAEAYLARAAKDSHLR